MGLTGRPDAKKLKTVVEEFLLRVEVLPRDSEAEAARQYSRIRAVLVSSDAVFRRVKGLKTEDWTK